MYRRGFDGVLLRCLEWENQYIAIHTCHDGTCGGHFSGHDIAKCLICMGYYLSTMEKYYHEYIKKCVKC